MLVIVDAENVRRSAWPNISRERLIELLADWAAAHDANVLVVFDGPAPASAARVEAVGAAGETADDWIARHVTQVAEPCVLATSDRELRKRAAAAHLIGGGSFLRELTGADADADEPRQRGDRA